MGSAEKAGADNMTPANKVLAISMAYLGFVFMIISKKLSVCEKNLPARVSHQQIDLLTFIF